MKLDKKRRRQNKTNYNKRLILLKGNSPRLVVRKTNKHLILQIIKSKNAEDKVLFSVNTKELLKQGWPENKKGSLKSLSAAYFGGYLLGKKSQEVKERIILDSGLIPNTKGSRVYAAVKGISDFGAEIKYNDQVIPSEERIKGKFMKEDFSDIFNKIKENLK